MHPGVEHLLDKLGHRADRLGIDALSDVEQTILVRWWTRGVVRKLIQWRPWSTAMNEARVAEGLFTLLRAGVRNRVLLVRCCDTRLPGDPEDLDELADKVRREGVLWRQPTK